METSPVDGPTEVNNKMLSNVVHSTAFSVHEYIFYWMVGIPLLFTIRTQNVSIAA